MTDIDNITNTAIETVKKKNKGKGNREAYKNSPFVGNNAIKCTDEELRGIWDNVLTVYHWPKIDLNSDDAVEQRCSEYFEYCRAAGERPLIEGLAVAIGVDIRTLSDWELKKSRNGPGSRRSEIIKKAKNLVKYLLAQMAVNNKIYPNVWIFYGKNYFGMKDEQEIVVTPNSGQTPEITAEEIAARHQAAPLELPDKPDLS